MIWLRTVEWKMKRNWFPFVSGPIPFVRYSLRNTSRTMSILLQYNEHSFYECITMRWDDVCDSVTYFPTFLWHILLKKIVLIIVANCVSGWTISYGALIHHRNDNKAFSDIIFFFIFAENLIIWIKTTKHRCIKGEMHKYGWNRQNKQKQMGETRGEKDERKAIKLLDSSVQRGRIVQKKKAY